MAEQDKTTPHWSARSGVLRPVVMKYLNGITLTPEDIAIMRAYLRQWMRGAWQGADAEELRREVDRIVNHGSLKAWVRRADICGIDPF